MTAAPPTIVVDRVSRWFGSVVAVNEVSFEVSPGITGLLGPNGAGKTTLLRMMAGLARTSQGQIRILDQPVRDNPALYRRLGVMLEHESVYSGLTGRQFVELNARLQDMRDARSAAMAAIHAVNMEAAADRALAGYSRGMRQRMRLAATLVHEPDVLLLDEPLSGTDPRQRLEFMDVLARLASEGRTIVLSSHVLEEVEAMASQVLLIVGGRLAASGDFRAIRALLNDRPYLVRVECSDARRLAAGLVGEPAVQTVTVDGVQSLRVLAGDVRALQHAVPREAHRAGVRITRVEPLDDTLESVFAYLAGER